MREWFFLNHGKGGAMSERSYPERLIRAALIGGLIGLGLFALAFLFFAVLAGVRGAKPIEPFPTHAGFRSPQ